MTLQRAKTSPVLLIILARVPNLTYVRHPAGIGSRICQQLTLRGRVMKVLKATHVRNTDLMKRYISDGWYAISSTGKVCSQVFLTEAACVAHIERERVRMDAYYPGAAIRRLRDSA